MLPDLVSSPGPLTYESGALPIALRGPAGKSKQTPVYKEAVNNGVHKKQDKASIFFSNFIVYCNLLMY